MHSPNNVLTHLYRILGFAMPNTRIRPKQRSRRSREITLKANCRVGKGAEIHSNVDFHTVWCGNDKDLLRSAYRIDETADKEKKISTLAITDGRMMLLAHTRTTISNFNTYRFARRVVVWMCV